MLTETRDCITDGILMNVLILTLDKYQGDVLLVEGKTDKLFYDKILDNSCECIDVGSLFNVNQDYILERNPFENKSNVDVEDFNHKQMLVRIALISIMNKHILNDYAKYNTRTKRKNRFFAIVDRDNDAIKNIENLYYTDTYDLETMMLSTDPELLYNYRGNIITDENVVRSMFLAFQLSCTISLISNYLVYNDTLLYSLDWNKFITADDCFDLGKFLKVVQNKDVKKKSKNIEMLVKRKYKDGGAKYAKFLDSSGEKYIWKEDKKSFLKNSISDFWQRTNGHYLALAYAFVIGYKGRYTKTNREIETSWILNYKKEKFYITDLSNYLLKEGIIKTLDEVKSNE